MVSGLWTRVLTRGAAVVGLALGLFSVRAAPDTVMATGKIPPEVLSEARAALSSARAAMSGEAVSSVPFTPSRYPNVVKRSVPRAENAGRLVLVAGLPVPLLLPLPSIVGVEQPAATGGVVLVPDAATLPLTIATRPASVDKDPSHAAR